MRPVVLIESPYSGQGVEAIRYLACCLLDSFLRGEAPIASHAIGPLALPERGTVPCRDEKRRSGRLIGKETHAALKGLRQLDDHDGEILYGIDTILYVDFGRTSGMSWDAPNVNEIKVRKLEGRARKIWNSGRWPSNARWTTTNESETLECGHVRLDAKQAYCAFCGKGVTCA